MEFAVSVPIQRFADHPPENVSVTADVYRGERSVEIEVAVVLARNVDRSGPAILNQQIVRYARVGKVALTAEIDRSHAGCGELQYYGSRRIDNNVGRAAHG